MAEKKDITGVRYGRLTAICLEGRDKFGIGLWSCNCDCGKSITVRLCSLTSEATKSCGCLNKQTRAERAKTGALSRKHGLSRHPLYSSWSTMKSRCYNPNSTKYHLYGGRGIEICDRWKDSFVNFLEDMGERPNGCSLDRIDGNKGYSPENCKWSTYSDQNRNRRQYTRNRTGLFNEIA